jgi:hypothetical protein
MIVATRIRDKILTNTRSARGFGDDPYKKDLAYATQQVKRKKGTYAGTKRSTLRDEDHSITKLRVTGPKKNLSIIDFRSTGKGDLFYAHHYGVPPPSPYQPYAAKRSIIPMKEASVPMFIHELAARSILKCQGVPNIIVRTIQTTSTHDDWRKEVPF